jgi:hypothetical protein
MAFPGLTVRGVGFDPEYQCILAQPRMSYPLVLIHQPLTFAYQGQLPRQSPMGGGTLTVFPSHRSCRPPCPPHTTHPLSHCEEGAHNHHPVRTARSHHDALLQVSHCQCSRLFLHRNGGSTEFLGGLCNQRREQKRPVYIVG